MEQISQIFGLLAVLVAIIFAAYFATKYLANKATGGSGKTRHFRVIDRFSISKDKMFVLVAVGETVYLIGVTNQGMTLIDQKALSDVPSDDAFAKKTVLPNFLSNLKNASPFGNKKDGGGNNFSDFIKQARQKDDHYEE